MKQFAILWEGHLGRVSIAKYQTELTKKQKKVFFPPHSEHGQKYETFNNQKL